MCNSPTSCPVLVVDDDSGIRDALTELLEDEGYLVEQAWNGRDALARLRTGLRPCLILLDWKMPVMGGAQFRVEQKRDPTLSTIPVAVISAHVPHDRTEQVDADVFLAKPIQYDRLVETLARYCEG